MIITATDTETVTEVVERLVKAAEYCRAAGRLFRTRDDFLDMWAAAYREKAAGCTDMLLVGDYIAKANECEALASSIRVRRYAA